MPASGGSVTDNSVPTNKVVDGKSHYLAYITPDEGKSLVNQGGVPTMTNEGVIAYPPQGDWGGPSYGGSSSSSGPSGPPGGGATSQGSGRDYSPPSRDPGGHHRDTPVTVSQPTQTIDRDTYDEWATVIDTPEVTPTVISENVSKEPVYADRIQRISTGEEPGYRAQDSQPFGLSKEEAYRQGKITVDQRDADPVLTAPEERDLTRDLTFAEHWNLAPDALKYSPTLRLLWATGANLGEWSKRQGANVWDWGTGESNISPAPDRGDGPGATGTVSAAQSNYITSGQITPSNSVAANWYQSLGSSSASGNASAFNLASEYAAAKTKVKQTLGTPSAVGMLAVNDSPFFDFLQKHNLTKGIL